ncbi:transcription elongation factor TFIIS [Paraconiothyrium brasiliense]|uniref:Transcription elongation factor n=1 Tax=Paraconiothyrium brasiliense TaxID=300254 RepID=A0ABR3RH48_9PLEO
MDHKEVALRGKAISKAIEEKEPSASILKLLNELKDGIRPTEDLLRQTKIGVTVNKLRQHADPTVASLATRMVSKWREDVKNSKGSAARPKPSGTSNGTSSPAPVPSKTASPAPAPAPTPSKAKHSVDPAKRNHKTDSVKYQVTGDEQRDNCVRLMYDGLAFMSEELPADILKSARAVEDAVYDGAGSRVNDAYKQKIKSLFSNLKNKSSVHLRKRVQSGEISPKRFATMTHEEMKSDERKEADKKLEKENMNNAMVAQVEKSISKEFQCGKCKQRMVSYSQAQTRSADEPMTTFCECMNCGNRWKFS